MKNNRPQKGEYGYRDSHRKIQLAKVAFGGAMILLQLAARGLTGDQAVKNILTVMAILSVLPTANVASPLIASWKYRTPGRAFYEKTAEKEQDFRILYDLILTSREADHAAGCRCHPSHRCLWLLYRPQAGWTKSRGIFKWNVKIP
ncbi:MAG: hypothetical protein ACLTKI_07530 [Lachnospiraceae bacterium]